ncbi:MAG: hypothetical protein ACRD9R_07915 [Pyrinomonadaceae bacterium]
MRKECRVLLLTLVAVGATQFVATAFDREKMGEDGTHRAEPKPRDPAAVPDAVRPSPAGALMPAPLEPAGKDQIFWSAYYDVFRLLSEDNPCSRFYGGSAGALKVFNALANQLERASFNDPEMGARMDGYITNVKSAATGLTYRMFDRATLNADGAFYHSSFSARRRLSPVGRYRAGTRPARALILLHELGHLMHGEKDNEWLLPNDGGNPMVSERNTALVEGKCRKQLAGLEDEAQPENLDWKKLAANAGAGQSR